jgi:hypothetical protein
MTNNPPTFENGQKKGATAFERSRLLEPVRHGTRAYTISVNQQYQKGMVGPNKNMKRRDKDGDQEYWSMIRMFIDVRFILSNTHTLYTYRRIDIPPGHITLHSEAVRGWSP